MENFWKSTFSIIILALLCSLALNAQTNQPQQEKEVIIIEKVKDENGNVISKKIIRSSDGDMSDKEIEEALKDAQSNPFQQFNFGNEAFDLGNLFGQDMSQPATLGIRLKSTEGQVEIEDIVPGSGAADAELQSGDVIVSADGFVVNTIDDLKEYISDRNNGDKVLLSIVRDGQSFDKEVELRTNNFNNPFGNISPDLFENLGQMDPSMFESLGQMFDFGDGFSLDSLFQNFGNLEELKGLNDGIMPFNYNMPGYSDRAVEEDRPSLGVFVDEVSDGVIIAEVLEGSAAEKAKLKINDKIIKIDGATVGSFDDLARMIRAAGKNTEIRITYIRNGKMKEADVLLQ